MKDVATITFQSAPQPGLGGRPQRDLYWDTLKFVLIVLVVYGHFIHNPGTLALAVFNTIYTFHMPLFVFVSGRFTHLHDRKRYFCNIIRLLETFLFFHVFWTLLCIFLGASPSINLWISPATTYWYLLALVYWRIGVFLLPPANAGPRRCAVVFISSVAISILSGFLPVSDAFTVQRALAFFPFFLAGYYTAEWDWRWGIRKIPNWLAWVGLIGLFLLFWQGLPDVSLRFVHYCKWSYWDGGTRSDWWGEPVDWSIACAKMGLRCLFLLLSSLSCLFVMRVIRANRLLAKWGSATLVIYVYHKFFFYVIHGMEKSHLMPGGLLAWTIETLLAVAFLTWVSRFRWPWFLANPISNLLQWWRGKRHHAVI